MIENFWASKLLFILSQSPLFKWIRLNEATDTEMNAISSAFIINAFLSFFALKISSLIYSRSAYSLYREKYIETKVFEIWRTLKDN